MSSGLVITFLPLAQSLRNNFAKTDDTVLRIKIAKQLYDNMGTLQEVGNLLNLTRERIRQLLAEGIQRQIFEQTSHQKNRKSRKRLKDLKI